MFDKQIEIEQTYSKRNTNRIIEAHLDMSHEVMTTMIDLIGKARLSEFTYVSKAKRWAQINNTNEEIAKSIAINVLKLKGNTTIQHIALLVGRSAGIEHELDAVTTGAELLAICMPAGMYTLEAADSEMAIDGTITLSPQYVLEPHVREQVEEAMYLPPMVCKPREWTRNKGGGYLTEVHSAILKKGRHHDMPLALDVLNLLQDIEFHLCEMVNYEEPATDKVMEKFDSMADFIAMRDKSTAVYEMLMEQGNRFHFVWQFDSRGRMYNQGYHCTLQGSKYKRAILNFGEPELIKG